MCRGVQTLYRASSKVILQVAGEKVHPVERVLDVRQGELCWVIGTVYIDMPLKPNILDDISKDVSSPRPCSLVQQ